MKGFFVTGTDTGIGKSLVAAALLQGFAAQGLRVAGMKPIAAGAVWNGQSLQNEDVSMLAAASNVDIPAEMRCPYLLAEPAAPHLAAEMEGVSISIDHIERCYLSIASRTDIAIVEGVGGFRLPLGENIDTADLAVRLNLPVIMVVGMRLGCLNHAIITAEAISDWGLRLAGWVANTVDPGMPHLAANLAALETRLPAPLLGHIPHMVPSVPDSAVEHLTLSHLLQT
jgi:dethiobiotin synthetase